MSTKNHLKIKKQGPQLNTKLIVIYIAFKLITEPTQSNYTESSNFATQCSVLPQQVVIEAERTDENMSLEIVNAEENNIGKLKRWKDA